MTKRRITGLIVFLVAAYGGAWLLALPLWLGPGLDSPYFRLLSAAMMFTPSLGVLAVWLIRRISPWEWAARTGLTLGPSKGRTAAFVIAAWIGTPLLIAVALEGSVALGLLRLDLGEFSLFREVLRQGGTTPADDLRPLVIAQIVTSVLVGPAVNAVHAFGEEWGWRGWLLPTLISLYGTRVALPLSGVIWGAWHAPVTLLGYNYPNLGPWAAAYFIGFCVVGGLVLGWLRIHSASIWPAVVAHGAMNASVPVILLLGDSREEPNLVFAGLTGLMGWVLLAGLAFVLYRIRPLRAESIDQIKAAH
ncbi:CPBP family intramembrane glutamic endopeptidase [Nonomuraea insulae]|uniref:CPBP family intramembrane glutamic endopeptidase n=1 Tax=Nonomuraea insulae TaxID=1616787 RepID=A0ABW1CG52_9ACTN